MADHYLLLAILFALWSLLQPNVLWVDIVLRGGSLLFAIFGLVLDIWGTFHG